MKIGIMTFWWSQDNYGQLLQCYALQKYLRDAGHDAYLIRYVSDNDYDRAPVWKKILKAFNPVFLYKYICGKLHSSRIRGEQRKNDRHFEDFRESFIKVSDLLYTSYAELKENPPEADIYIVGSDQVWNPKCIGMPYSAAYKRIVNAYFLNFGFPKTKRVSYAASWGIKSLDEEKIDIIKPLLAKFDFVSVREQSGVEICKLCGYEEAKWVCDPTILLTADTYREIYRVSKIRKIEKPFILLYMLNNEFNFDINNVYDFARLKNLSVVYVTGNGVIDNRDKFFATIPEWLYLVDNAEYIVTNSFHCGVFSTIFSKRYGIVPLCGTDSGMNSRFDSLFELYKINERYISDNNFNVLDIDYEAKIPSSQLIKVLLEL